MSETNSRTTPMAGAAATGAAPGGGAPGGSPPATPTALRRMGVEVQGRVDEYLVRLDVELARRNASPAQRRVAGVNVRNRIMQKLAGRVRPGAAGAGGAHLTAGDVDAVLAELGPAERQADEVTPAALVAPKYTGPRKLAKPALLGACWALMFPGMWLLSRIPLDLPPEQAPPWWYDLVQMIVYPLGWSALVAPTVLGFLAIDQIHKSKGRLYGLSLALFTAAIYPLLMIDYVVFWLSWQVAGALLQQNTIGEPLARLVTQILPTVICVLGDYFLVVRAWVTVRGE